MTQLKKDLRRIAAAVAALVMLVTGMMLLASAEEEMEIVSSYPYTTVTKVQVNLRAARSVRAALIRKIPSGAEISTATLPS